jgi:hypothetical protein
MRAAILLCPLFVTACATTTAKDLQSMPIAEVCYLGMVEPEKQQMVLDEVRRRNEDCNKYSAEIAKIRDLEARAGANPVESSGSGAQRGGGMGRGY